MVYPNNGFMGFPIALSLLGSKGLLFMMAQNSAMNVMFFTHTMKVLHRNEKNKNNVTVKSIVKNIVMLLLNPNILAMFVGLALCFGGISLDNPVGTYLQYIGNAATPMAMIFIGSTLAESHILEMINNHIIWESSISKLILKSRVGKQDIVLCDGFIYGYSSIIHDFNKSAVSHVAEFFYRLPIYP